MPAVDRSKGAPVTYVTRKNSRNPQPSAGRCPRRRVTRVRAQQQRQLSRAIKNAREMALLPYASR
ncbi:30S ribosomal protein S18 [Streptomyces caniferus]|uniref:30S ribosomal protein S18 n=1 Tax=Streptomyces caniferus TaxID=285557 RepID=UPI00383A2990